MNSATASPDSASHEAPDMVSLDRRTGIKFAAWKWAWGLLGTALVSAVYFFVGHVGLARSTTMLETALDRALPFWPWTFWFYEPVYIGIFVIGIVAFRSRLLFLRSAMGAGICMLVSTIGFLAIPAQYPRPALHPPFPDVSTAALAWFHTFDPAGNVFPSLHVALTSMLALTLRRDQRRIGNATMVLAGLLALSTLTTKQHFIADVLGGYALAFATYAWIRRGVEPRDQPPRAPTRTEPRQAAD